MKRIVFDASYLVLGLGDVYLGAPVATPLDPRHRLVTTKYNPARTWTPENAVGIGGAYLCVYGMEGPGGYQFVGRTLPDVEPLSRRRADFVAGKPWLLRFFDQIRFYPVGADELLAIRDAFPRGRVRLRIEETTFRFADYQRVPGRERGVDRGVPRAAAGGVRRRARALGVAAAAARRGGGAPPRRRAGAARGRGRRARRRHGQRVGGRRAARHARRRRRTLVIIETMKMEIPVLAPAAGTVVAVCCTPGALVRAGQTLVGLRPDA